MSDYKNNDVDDFVDKDNDGRDDKEEFLCEGSRLLYGGKFIDKKYLKKILIAAVCLVILAIFFGVMHMISILPKSTEPTDNPQPVINVNVNTGGEK